MTKVLNMNERGTLTLPKELRQRIGLDNGGQIFAEATPDGILLRAGATFPMEIYDEARVAEFQRNNEDALVGFEFKK